MEDFDHYGFSRQDLSVRAAHSLCRAGWTLAEINGVLQNGHINPEGFQLIQQQATILDQLQRKFGPPPTVSPATVSTDIKLMEVDIRRMPTLRVMNRGVEEAAAVLSHHGWHFSQIRSVLKAPATPLGDSGLALVHELQQERQTPRHILYQPPPAKPQRQTTVRVFKAFLVLFWLGMLFFIGVSLILHML